jgi:MFS family permease
MKREIGTNDNLMQQKSTKAESAKKKAVIVGLICFPAGVIFGLFCLFFGMGYLVQEEWSVGFILMAIACFCCFIALVGLSSFIAALIIKLGFRKATGWVIIATGALLAIGSVIFFATQYYDWGENHGRNAALILLFIFTVLSPFIGWKLLTHRRHPKHTEKPNDT